VTTRVKTGGPTCATCKKPVKPRAENPAFPFCSTRCQQVDLGKWLNEEYRMPAEEADGEAAQSADRSTPGDDPEGSDGTPNDMRGGHN
jgi:endogenous inhibitor of DNA gyrase (YacG/DUF329 family)